MTEKLKIASIGTDGILRLQYYGEYQEAPGHGILVGNSRIDITRRHQKPGTGISEVYDWHGHNHFDGTEFGMKAKLDLLRGRPTEVENTIREGYISANMCLAAQQSIETGTVVKLDL